MNPELPRAAICLSLEKMESGEGGPFGQDDPPESLRLCANHTHRPGTDPGTPTGSRQR